MSGLPLQLCAKFLVEEPDEETMKAELKEAFRVYDRDGAGFITTDQLRDAVSHGVFEYSIGFPVLAISSLTKVGE